MLESKSVIRYLVSAICLNNDVVTHFVVHQFDNAEVSPAYKISRDELKKLFSHPDMSVYTAEWDFNENRFIPVQQVYIKNSTDSFHFYVKPENEKTENLRHLNSFDW